MRCFDFEQVPEEPIMSNVTVLDMACTISPALLLLLLHNVSH